MEDQQNIFSIQDLNLGYEKDKTVLRIEELNIKRGELTFIIGPSGAGKSTLLESLGLMKDTLYPSADSRMLFSASNGEAIDLTKIWNQGDEAATNVRSEFFSFIFQSTNLMPNFTIGENICYTGMLDGRRLSEVKETAVELMDRMNLDPSLFDKDPTMASGGQRQRAAFVRALCKDFDVLFCDEPTGNLDQGNAISLMEMVQQVVKEKNRSAIIVSHDIQLSDRFADVVVEIEMSNNMGLIALK
jgi:putative ABC transport system ATP-binding protein